MKNGDFYKWLYKWLPVIMLASYIMAIIISLCNGSLVVQESPSEPTTEVTVKLIQEKIEEPQNDADETDDIPGVDVDKPAMVARYRDIAMTEEEKRELAAVVYLEAGNQTDEGRQAVAEVVFNRVISDDFPGTVRDVLHQGEGTALEQFTTVSWIDSAEPPQAAYDAIDAALYGESILPNDVVYFSTGGENDRVWGKIGDHVFCYGYEW